ncbi:hypothetical protein DYB37_003542 [Aphanomyces astaci]|uniref:Uncharacterized protein n=1 Tax=Aphanomyces astaci TaxID=112090 RepID=A0A3R6YPX7_APHAT|nr:hypothetical protein DYB35_002248 [Aphanomyces astaci]RHZ21073.1 hypothetical protein DYB37_003542 [Aphanomyces astaci]
MGLLLKPVMIFPHDNNIPEGPSLPKLLDAIQHLERAIKSVDSYPAKNVQMMAFLARRDELSALGGSFAGKVATAFDTYMHTLAKATHSAGTADQFGQSRRRSLSGGHEAASPRKNMFSRDHREGSDAKDDRSTNHDDVDWRFRNDKMYSNLIKYQDIFQSIVSLSPKSAVILRDVYAKYVVPVYSAHIQAVFRTLKDKVPKPKPHGLKASQWNINLSFSHAPSESTISVSASTLLQQALEHIVPLCIAEQQFIHAMFFASTKKATTKPEPLELTLLMEKLFEKLPKRLVEFGDAGVSANVFEAVSMIVSCQQQLKALDTPTEYVVNTLLNFQLHLKRSLSKYMEDQVRWTLDHISLFMYCFHADECRSYGLRVPIPTLGWWGC